MSHHFNSGSARALLLLGTLCAGHALAQSGVTISGTLDLGVSELRTTTAAGVTTRLRSMTGGGIQTPTFGISGAEDLGNGLRATFALSSYLNRMDIGGAGRNDTDGFWSAASNVGLTSREWGTLRVGRITTPTIIALFDTNAWLGSTTYGSSFLNNWSGVVLGDTGFSNAVRYDSPSIKGVQAQIMYSLGSERDTGPDKRFGVAHDWRLDYVAGPLRATVAGRSINQSVNGNGREQKMTIVGAAYDFGVLAAFGQYVTVDDRYNDSAADVDRGGVSLGVRVPVGALVVIASTAVARIDDVSAATPARRRTSALGVDYFLSKRTDLYLAGSTDRFTSPAGTKATRIGAGIRHKF